MSRDQLTSAPPQDGDEDSLVTAGITFRVATDAADRAAVKRLRDAVYVRDQSRLAHAEDMADTFDRFDRHAVYLLAMAGAAEVGTIKIIPDSPIGLPCDDTADIRPLRLDGNPVEFGHMLTLPTMRGQSIGMGLMRHALVYSITTFGATHIVGDFFVDDTGILRQFYRDIGFVPVNEPYADARFKGAPLSLVAALDLADAAARLPSARGRQRRLLRHFFHDYQTMVGRRADR